MSLRNLVTGSDTCTPSGADGAGPSNALGSLVNNLLGGAAKTQEQLRELPHVQAGMPHGAMPMGPEAAAAAAAAHAASFQVPGAAGPSSMGPANMALLHGLGLGPGPGPGAMMDPSQQQEWDQIFGGGRMGPEAGPHHMPGLPPGLPGPTAALSRHFKAFVSISRAGPQPLAPGPAPPELAAGLSVVDRCRIRDRATILARHMYAEAGPAFADGQVNHLLASLHINAAELPTDLQHVHEQGWHGLWEDQQRRGGALGPPVTAGPLVSEDLAAGAHAAHWEGIWREGAGARPPGALMPPGGLGLGLARPVSTGWAAEFAGEGLNSNLKQGLNGGGGGGWAAEFAEGEAAAATAGGANAWANEFESAQAEGRLQSGAAVSTSSGDAMQSTRALADLLAKDSNPKMRNSNFLQFVSKLSRGELIFDDNKVVERSAGAAWADEFATAAPAAATGPGVGWAEEFSTATGQLPGQLPGQPPGLRGDWADEFARGVADLKLAEGEEGDMAAAMEKAWREGGAGAEGAASWFEEFNKGEDAVFEEWERIYGHGHYDTALDGDAAFRQRGEYVFARNNPFMGDPDALAKGRDLFKRGVLTEAALALEAEVQSHPDNAEAWRLLGTVHAENDDDQQAIAAMSRALNADPSSLDVRLSLGVSHTNELDTGEAVQHLYRWLESHPQYGPVVSAVGAPPDSSQALSHTVRVFEAASRQAPEDFEVRVALGVLHHLSRQYSAAISAFEEALKIRPQDYSLWNKLGATLANNSRSSEAIYAYQKALDLKPNYMRAWTNMGISFANLGDYDKSARFYVRALGLNPSASHVWGYLRTALACAGHMDLIRALDDQDLATLQARLPLTA